MRSRLWLVRHGETEWSRSGRHTGRTDVPLLTDGERQAAALGRWLGERVSSPSLVLTSPLARAAETCRLAGFGERARVSDDLLEWDYGEYEGLTSEEIRRERPGWTLWFDGAPGGETAAEVGRRADRVIEMAKSADGDVLAFGHGHTLRTVAARWVELPPVEGRLLALGVASVGTLGWEREVPVVERWNERPAGV